jgi:hypothetical protein
MLLEIHVVEPFVENRSNPAAIDDRPTGLGQ